MPSTTTKSQGNGAERPPLWTPSWETGNFMAKPEGLVYSRGEEDWLDQLPEFEKLQILSLENLGPEIRFIDHSILENIASCQHLQVLNLHFGEFRDEEELIQIARCCPLLREFSVGCIDF